MRFRQCRLEDFCLRFQSRRTCARHGTAPVLLESSSDIEEIELTPQAQHPPARMADSVSGIQACSALADWTSSFWLHLHPPERMAWQAFLSFSGRTFAGTASTCQCGIQTSFVLLSALRIQNLQRVKVPNLSQPITALQTQRSIRSTRLYRVEQVDAWHSKAHFFLYIVPQSSFFCTSGTPWTTASDHLRSSSPLTFSEQRIAQVCPHRHGPLLHSLLLCKYLLVRMLAQHSTRGGTLPIPMP